MARRKKLTRTLIGGAVGGIAGLTAMRMYWSGATAITGKDPRAESREDEGPLDDIAVPGEQYREGESSTAAAGRIANEAVTGGPPRSSQRKERLSHAVHWGFGLAMAMTYAALRGRVRPPDLLGGLAFGAAVWVLADELIVPLLGLTKGPTAYPARQHAHRLGAHLAYGIAASSAAQLAARRFDGRSRRDRAWHATKEYARKGSEAAERQARRALELVRP